MAKSLAPSGQALALLAVLLAFASTILFIAPARAVEAVPVMVEDDVRIPMSDGVTLSARVFRPKVEGKKFPGLVLARYWQTGEAEGQFFPPHEYAVVLLDSRGRGRSGGKWHMYINEPRDGHDAQVWVAKQPWCDGNIGTFGQSYNSFTAVMPAPMGNPNLKCIFAVEGQQTNFGHIYNDGIMQLNMVYTAGLYTTGSTQVLPHKAITDPFFKRLPLVAQIEDFPEAKPWVSEWFKHNKFDDYWKSYGIYGKYDKIKAPAYFATGWYDNLVHEGLKNFKGFHEEGGSKECREGTKIRVGPTAHGGAWGQFETQLRWCDYWLKGIQNGIDKEPPIQIYVMGAEKWRGEQEWPLARTKFTNFYLGGTKTNSLKGDGTLLIEAPAKDATKDQFVYDPENPVYTLGGQISTNPEVEGPKDRQALQKERDDILVFTTAPLEHDTEVTGPVDAKLFAASTAVDTDFTATLTDVYPDGRALHICEGIRGTKFRESLENPSPIEPGKVYELTISLWETSQLFKAGHRIRLEISSSNFPRYARNQNTGLPFGTSDKVLKATQTIYRDADHPSRLILPIIPAEPEKK